MRTVLLALALVIIGVSIYTLERGDAGPLPSTEAPVDLVTATGTGITTATNTPVASTPVPAQILSNVLTLEQKAERYEKGKELAGISGYFNTPSNAEITLQSLVGKKVILVDFWTYSCINCQRTQPYLNAWYDKYKDQGLEIIGVHTPEFEFEKSGENVARAISQAGVEYPVVQDNEYATWRAYNNRFWPRKYLIDIDGFIVYDHIGEGAYAETEGEIQRALLERAAKLGGTDPLPTGTVRPTAVVGTAGSPETYFGAHRNEYLGNGTRGTVGIQTFTLPLLTQKNVLYLGGEWNIADEYAVARSGATVRYQFTGRFVYVVASAPTQSTIGVRLDGKAQPGVSVSSDQLYTLIALPTSGEHILELSIPADVKLYAFTFG